MDKAELRSILRKRRQSLDQTAIDLASSAMCHQLITLPQIKAAQKIAIYSPFDGEISPLGLVAMLPEKDFYLPVIGDNFSMEFRPFANLDDCQLNRYGILEPTSQQTIAPLQLDLVVLPLVGFDSHGHRLGMGGGYYDRAFTNRQQQPILVGVGYNWQQVEGLKAEAWDVDIDAIVTDSAIIQFANINE